MDTSANATAFITGGAQGIGLGIARALLRRGMRVALADVDDEALARAAKQLDGRGAVETFELDVRDRQAFAEVADAVERRFGPVSVLVNNAGVGVGVFQAISQEVAYPTWDYVLGVNLEGVNNGVTTFLPRMIARGGSAHIVNTASAAGLVVFPERSSGYTYHASKFAVMGLTEALHRGLRDEGRDIGVSVLIPGMVATEVATNSLDAAPEEVVSAAMRAQVRPLTSAGDAALTKYGRDVDSVGELVAEAIGTDRLYIPTDRLAAEALDDRTRALLDAMPSPHDGYDRALGAAMAERRENGPAATSGL